MNFGCRSAVLLAMVVLGTWPLLAGTKIVHRWVLTGLPMPQFKRILVAGVMENYLVRQDFEDVMKTQLAKYGVDGVRVSTFCRRRMSRPNNASRKARSMASW